MSVAYMPDAAQQLRRAWHMLMDGPSQVVWGEVGAVIQAPGPGGVTPTLHEKQMRYAELVALVEEAERGELDSGSWDYVARDPDLWELRLACESGVAEIVVRGYFHEPGRRPRDTVLAKVHVKDVSSNDQATIRELQNIEIDEASARISRCGTDDWGIDREGRRLRGGG